MDYSLPAIAPCVLRSCGVLMKVPGAILLIGLSGGVAIAEDAPAPLPATTPAASTDGAEQLAAARAEAVGTIMQQIEALPLTADTTVRDYIYARNGVAALREMIAAGDEPGGPRWLDAHVAQVSRTVDGAKVAELLRQLAGSDAAQLQNMDPALKEMSARTFSATGTSTALSFATAFTETATTATTTTPTTLQQQAVDAARQDASLRILQSIRNVKVGDTTLGDIFKSPDAPVTRDVMDYLSTRPVTGMAATSDANRVELKLSVPPSEMFELLKASLTSRNHAATPQTDADWNRLRNDLYAALGEPVGTGYAMPQQAPPAPEARAVNELPAWVRQQIDATGQSPPVKSALLTARAAERNAQADLRKQVEALVIDKDTLGKLAESDPRVAQAIDRAMIRARLYKTDYLGDGSVAVKVSLELKYVWEELTRQ
jgi:hypothetical protein